MNWRKSTRSGNQGNCVEVAASDQHVYVRDSKDPNPELVFDRQVWAAFLNDVKAGKLD